MQLFSTCPTLRVPGSSMNDGLQCLWEVFQQSAVSIYDVSVFTNLCTTV
jgi:hypothetical protein